MIPRFCGVTSRSSTSSARAPGSASACAWIAAPSATTSSGWTPRHGSRPKKSFTAFWTRGMRVMPPTRITSPTWAGRTPASLSVRSVTWMQRSTRSFVRSSSCSRVSCLSRWSAPLPSPAATRNGRWIAALATAEIEHHDLLLDLLAEPVGERGARGLVDDPEHVEARDLACVLRRLPLAVVEVGGYGDHRLAHRPSEPGLGVGTELREHDRGDLRDRGGAARELHPHVVSLGPRDELVRQHAPGVLDLLRPPAPADEPLRGVDRVLGVGDRLPLRERADELLPVLRDRDDRRREELPVPVWDDARHPITHRRDDRVGRPEIDSDDGVEVAHPRKLQRSFFSRSFAPSRRGSSSSAFSSALRASFLFPSASSTIPSASCATPARGPAWTAALARVRAEARSPSVAAALAACAAARTFAGSASRAARYVSSAPATFPTASASSALRKSSDAFAAPAFRFMSAASTASSAFCGSSPCARSRSFAAAVKFPAAIAALPRCTSSPTRPARASSGFWRASRARRSSARRSSSSLRASIRANSSGGALSFAYAARRPSSARTSRASVARRNTRSSRARYPPSRFPAYRSGWKILTRSR